MNISRGTFDYVFIDLSNTQVPFLKNGAIFRKVLSFEFRQKG